MWFDDKYGKVTKQIKQPPEIADFSYTTHGGYFCSIRLRRKKIITYTLREMGI
jgi:hypothetical protein